MKRLLVLALALLMAVGAAASAEALPGGARFDAQNPAEVDLDGDGVAERIACTEEPEEDYEGVQVLVTGVDGAPLAAYDCDIAYGCQGWVGDLNGDGQAEILAWGDVMSDDYYTVCLHYIDGRLIPALFADVERGENGNGYYKEGYGYVDALDPQSGTVTLCGSQDVLGTWFATRTLALSADGLFEVADDGRWVRADLPEGEDAWDSYTCLTVRTTLGCTVNGAADTLDPGDRIFITGSDKQFEASFLSRDGRTGTLAIQPDDDQGWGWLVDGIPEADAFEFVPYAD